MKKSSTIKNNKTLEEDIKIIEAIRLTYNYHRRMLYESNNGLVHYDDETLRRARVVVGRIEHAYEDLSIRLQPIIKAEVLSNLRGSKWYTEYYAAPTYYAIRGEAYRKFLEILD